MRMDSYQTVVQKLDDYQDPIYPMVTLSLKSNQLADLFVRPWLRGDVDEPLEKEVTKAAAEVLEMLTCILNDMDIPLEHVACYSVKKIDRELEGDPS